MTGPEQTPGAPLLRVVNADATPEEVAAIVAVLSALGGGTPPPAPPRSEWAAPYRTVRRTGTTAHASVGVLAGTRVGGWRSSALPR